MRGWLAVLMFQMLVAPASAEVIGYAIYSVPLFWGEPRLVSEGQRTYLRAEVKTAPGPAPSVPNWTKTLTIAEGFELGASVYREAERDGFGLWIKRNGSGFSWEWFVRESSTIYRKLQGTGRVRVNFVHFDDLQQLAEIEFLDDVTMRLDRLWLVPFRDRDTDHLVIRRGSVFWLAP